jgi:hypothetical protein
MMKAKICDPADYRPSLYRLSYTHPSVVVVVVVVDDDDDDDNNALNVGNGCPNG